MIKLIADVASKFGVSKPIYCGNISRDGDEVSFRLKKEYVPTNPCPTDPIGDLVAKSYTENLHHDRAKFIQTTHLPSVYKDIMTCFLEFFEDRAPLKNPRQSKVYKWLKTMQNGYNHPSGEGFIALYRYLNKPNPVDADLQNVLAILELMREKYEDTTSSHQ